MKQSFLQYHYPARFDLSTTESILANAEQIFKLFGMKDFARFDGWVLENGQIIEEGSHQELLQLGKQYAHLWNRQAQGLDA